MVEIRSKELRQVLEHLQRYDIQPLNISAVHYSKFGKNIQHYGDLYCEGAEKCVTIVLFTPRVIPSFLQLGLDYAEVICKYGREKFDLGLNLWDQQYTLYGERVSKATKDALDRAFTDIGWHEESH